MELYNKNDFSHLFSEYAGCIANIAYPFGNAGDWLIWEGMVQLMKKFDISILNTFPADPPRLREENIIKSDITFWSGGGNMGDFYKSISHNPQRLRRLTKILCDKNKKNMVILPQTWTSKDDDTFFKMYRRENSSLFFEPKSIFCHDLALGFEPDQIIESLIKRPVISEIGYFFRDDIEKNVKIKTENLLLEEDPVLNCDSFYHYFEKASRYKIIHTNRLHFAVCGLFLEREVYLYNNLYFKNKAVFEASLSRFPNSHFVDDKD